MAWSNCWNFRIFSHGIVPSNKWHRYDSQSIVTSCDIYSLTSTFRFGRHWTLGEASIAYIGDGTSEVWNCRKELNSRTRQGICSHHQVDRSSHPSQSRYLIQHAIRRPISGINQEIQKCLSSSLEISISSQAVPSSAWFKWSFHRFVDLFDIRMNRKLS